MRRKLIAFVLVLPLVVAARGGRARAAASATTEPAPSDAGLIVGESLVATLTLGAASAVATGGMIVSVPAGMVLFALAPAAVGGAVCAIGSLSAVTTGRCGSAIGSAYLGALAAIPAGLIGLVITPDTSNHEGLGKTGGLLVGAALGYFVGTTVGAVVGWNVKRAPRDPKAPGPHDRLDARADAPAAPWLELERRRDTADTEPSVRLAVPLLAFRF